MTLATTGNPFSVDGQFYRGSVHNHTLASDGQHSVTELCKWYQDHGMDFVVITDHDTVADVSEADALDITVIPGAEIAVCWDETYGSEILALGIDEVKRIGVHPQDVINDVLEQGGLPYVSHPHLSGVYSGLMMELDGLVGIETYNHGGVRMGNRGVAALHQEDLMAVGKIVWGLATDDRHAIDAHGPQAWIEVKAESNDREALMNAMRNGHYYSTNGPKIHNISFSDTHVIVECSEAQRVTFSTLPWLSNKVDATDDGPITKTEARLETIGSGKTVELFTQRLIDQKMLSKPKEIIPHVRIEIDDGQGGFAWSNPFPI
ncbi:MAG: PHP domain-containing protein [Lentisphaeria bacterium]|nr:PHP domain-containing protein [Lentisphaeria bacterium]